MRYITIEDLDVHIQEQMLMSSIQKDESLLDSIESLVIDEVCSYIGARYKTEEIFEKPVRNGLLIQVIAILTAYRAVGRNAARKFGQSGLGTQRDWAYSMLNKISTGELPLVGMPEIMHESGRGSIFCGSTKKSNYYI